MLANESSEGKKEKTRVQEEVLSFSFFFFFWNVLSRYKWGNLERKQARILPAVSHRFIMAV